MIRIEVKEGKLPWIIGIATVLGGIGLFFVPYAYYDESLAIVLSAYVVVFLIICSGIGLCVNAANRRLTVEERQICYVNPFGRKKHFSLDDIGYCRTALENGENRDYLTLYDLLGKKLCKLDYSMKNTLDFLQYLVDNGVKIECSERSDRYLKSIVRARFICAEEVPESVRRISEAAESEIAEWLKKNAKFGAAWKMGVAVYLEKELDEKRSLWEQKGYSGNPPLTWESGGHRRLTGLPEGFLIAIEGYLHKEGQFVLDKKERTVNFCIPVIRVVNSMQTEEKRKIRFFEDTIDELAEQLAFFDEMLPKNRYHTGDILLQHELYTKQPFGIG